MMRQDAEEENFLRFKSKQKPKILLNKSCQDLQKLILEWLMIRLEQKDIKTNYGSFYAY